MAAQLPPLSPARCADAFSASDDVRVGGIKPIVPAACILDDMPVTAESSATVDAARTAVNNVIRGQDDRFIVIVGPCSIHDPAAAIEYGAPLPLSERSVTRRSHPP